MWTFFRPDASERLPRAVFLLAALLLLRPAPLPAQVLLTEFGAANIKTLQDEDLNAEDWIELCNVSGATVNLEGWRLTDDAAEPAKWRFPSTNLGPGQFLVVFASDKNRRTPGRPLHTNFRLSASGEYLALIRPDGTIATAFDPAYPPQATDISYGLPESSQAFLLVPQGAPGWFLVPQDSALGDSWTAPDFTETTWVNVKNGVGFGTTADLAQTDVAARMYGLNPSAYLRFPFLVEDAARLNGLTLRVQYNDGFIAFLNGTPVASRNAPVETAGGILADSLADWSATGQQGYQNWYYGFYDRGSDPDGVYDPHTEFLVDAPNWTWNGGAWVLGPSNPPWDSISSGGWHPNGSNSAGGVHWAIRRWICQASGTAIFALKFAKENTACGNGTTIRLLHNGVERFSRTVAGNDGAGIQTNLVVDGLNPGDLIDFALDPLGTDGSTGDSCDGSTFALTISQSPSEDAQWNSTATAFRTLEQTRQPETVDLRKHLDLLVSGTNVVALQGLNIAANDNSFLLIPELTGAFSGMAPDQRAYFNTPSPGRPNGTGSTNLGPIIDQVTHAPNEPGDADDLVVHAQVTPTLSPVQSVSLRYRVNYLNEAALPMYDDGQHSDGAAGDGVFAGRIPSSASTPGQMVRYAIIAVDSLSRTSRAPAFREPLKSPQYFGTVVANPAVLTNTLPVLHWFIQNPSGADSDATARVSVYFNGEFYDNVGMDLHGQSTRGFPKKSYDIDFNPGNRFRWNPNEDRVDDLNLLTTWADKSHMRNVLAHETYRDAGAASHFAFPVRVQKNGAFFSVANVVENGGEDFLRRLGLDPRGALYKMYNSAESAAGAEKKSRKDEGNADLQALITGMRQTPVSARQAFLYDNLNVPAMINFLAAKMITSDTDCCHKNYYLYRDSDGTGLWQAMPWDVDLSFGRVWTCTTPCLAYYDEKIYTNTSIFVGSGNYVFSPLYDTPATRQMFLRRLRSLMDQLLQPPGTPPEADAYRLKTARLRDQIAPDAALDLAKWGTWGTRETITQAVNRIWNEFLPGRRGWLFERLSVTNRGEIPLSQPADVVVSFHGMEFRAASGNPLQEWVSITNANNFAVDISGWQINGGIRFTFHPGTVIPSRSAVFVSPDIRSFLGRPVSPHGSELRLVVGPYSGNLSAWGESLTLVDPNARTVSTRSWTGDPSDAQRYLRITEIFYNPDVWPANPTIDPQNFEFIELRNIGPITLNLAGIRFTEGIAFDFTGGTISSLAPGARVLVVKDPAAFALRYGPGLPIAGQYTGNLDNGGERLRLDDAFGEKILDFSYSDAWLPITDGHGFSLAILDEALDWSAWNLSSSWRLNGTPSGTPGTADPTLVVPGEVVINEILAHTTAPLTDAIELLNPGNAPVDVANWFLTDDFGTPRKYRVSPPALLPPGGYLWLTEADFNQPGQPNAFALSAEGEEVWLFSADGAGNLTGYVQGFDFGPTANGVSLGRHVNSLGQVDYAAQKAVTPAAPNAGPLIGPVVISEIQYHPPASVTNLPASFIELANVTAGSTPLYHPVDKTNTWRLRNAVDFDFPENVALPAGGRLLVVGFDPATNATLLASFRSHYGIAPQVPVFGPFQGQLNNAGETIELKKPNAAQTNGVPYVLVEKVAYDDDPPWPPGADGSGASLQRASLHSYGNEPLNWFAAPPTAGAPNPENLFPAWNQLIILPAAQGFRLRYSGNPGLTSEFQRSSDLLQWTTIATLPVPADGLVEFNDTTAPLPSASFYRVIQK